MAKNDSIIKGFGKAECQKKTFKSKGMKRVNNIYEKFYNMENLILADINARKGKGDQYGVQMFDRSRELNLLLLQKMLIEKTYRTSAYTTFKIFEPKEREVYRLPYFPDRILHHAVMNQLEGIFMNMFTADTYSCIKGRGIHGFDKSIKAALRDFNGTQYCLKLDIKKFYPSVDHRVLKIQLRKKFKDSSLLWLLDEIIDSAPGLPIGNYLSQHLATFYLTGFDHWIKEVKLQKYYFRYADDIVLLSSSKQELHTLLSDIRKYFSEKLNLTIKGNYQIFPVDARGIDVVGYVYRHGFTRLRKSTKQNFARMLATRNNPASIASYKGWTKHANCQHLIKKLLMNEAVQ